MFHAALCPSPLGELYLEEQDGALCRVTQYARAISPRPLDGSPLLDEAIAQLTQYFAGTRQEFTLPLAPKGTPFQQKVWQALCTIPYGQTRTYGQIAAQVDCPKGSRAVGMANNKNPIMILIPCHRVIGANGKLVGYAGGLHIKEHLLTLEATHDQ